MNGPAVDEAIWRARLLVYLAIPAALLCALVSFTAGVHAAVTAVVAVLGDSPAATVLSPLLDAFVDLLLGAVLLTFAIGVYQLFVRPLSSQQWRAGVPRALHFGTVEELRDRMLSYLVMIASLALIAKIPEAHGTLGIAIGLVGVASLLILITAWRRQEDTAPIRNEPAIPRRTLEFPVGMFLDEPNAAFPLPSPRDRKLSDPFLAAERITRPRAPTLEPARRFVPVIAVIAVGGVAVIIGLTTLRYAPRPRVTLQPTAQVGEDRQLVMQRSLPTPPPVVVPVPVQGPVQRAPKRDHVVLKVRCRSGVVLHVFLDGDDTSTSCDGHDRIRTTAGPHLIGLFSPTTGRVRELRRDLEDPETRIWVKP